MKHNRNVSDTVIIVTGYIKKGESKKMHLTISLTCPAVPRISVFVMFVLGCFESSVWSTVFFIKTCIGFYMGDRGGTVVKVLCYKSEGRWFDSRWCHWNFSLT